MIIDIISSVIIVIGIIFMVIGAIGIFKFNNFYPRMLVTSKVDTIGFMTVSIGMIIRHGFTFFSLKLFFILALVLLINPLVSHVVTGAAYKSGYILGDEKTYRQDKEEDEENKEN